nr:putative Gag-Pol polyprotein [Tanacetum cinerariifolium]
MEDEIFFNQSKYVKEMLKKFGLEDSKPTKTPMSTEIKLTKDDESDSMDSSKYRDSFSRRIPVITVDVPIDSTYGMAELETLRGDHVHKSNVKLHYIWSVVCMVWSNPHHETMYICMLQRVNGKNGENLKDRERKELDQGSRSMYFSAIPYVESTTHYRFQLTKSWDGRKLKSTQEWAMKEQQKVVEEREREAMEQMNELWQPLKHIAKIMNAPRT